MKWTFDAGKRPDFIFAKKLSDNSHEYTIWQLKKVNKLANSRDEVSIANEKAKVYAGLLKDHVNAESPIFIRPLFGMFEGTGPSKLIKIKFGEAKQVYPIRQCSGCIIL